MQVNRDKGTALYDNSFQSSIFTDMRAYIEIFREGRHTSAQGRTGTYTKADLVRIRDAFNSDPNAEAVALIDRTDGHNEANAEVYGWVERLYVDKNESGTFSLYALFKNLDSGFVQLLRDRKYKNRSISLRPDEEGRDTYLTHVAFLGAALPAVKGMSDDGLPQPTNYTTDRNARRVYQPERADGKRSAPAQFKSNSTREYAMNEELRKELEEVVKTLSELVARLAEEDGGEGEETNQEDEGEGANETEPTGEFAELQAGIKSLSDRLSALGGKGKGPAPGGRGGGGNFSTPAPVADDRDRRIAELEKANRRNEFRALIFEDGELNERVPPKDRDGVIERLMKLDNGKDFSTRKGLNPDVEGYLNELRSRPSFTRGNDFAAGGKDTTDFAQQRKERAERIAKRTQRQ